MADTTNSNTKERTQSTRPNMDDPTEAIFDNSRRSFLGMMDFQRNNINAGYQFMREMHEESLRFADAWLDQCTRVQKTYLKSFNICNEEIQRQTEKTLRSNQEIIEEAVDRGLELVSTNTRQAAAAARRN